MNSIFKYSIKSLFLLGFYFIPVNFNTAQYNYMAGYVITNQNDTLHGMIKDRNKFPLKKYKKIRFINQKGKKKKLGPSDIRGYVKGDAPFETHWYDGKQQFLKPVLKGWVSYYQYEYARSSDDGSSIETEQLLMRFGENWYFEVEFIGFRKKMMAYLSDCPEIVQNLQDREYRFKDLERLILDYNKIMLARKAINLPE